jgi:transcriptional regulator of acetoin/glycerol metabolism
LIEVEEDQSSTFRLDETSAEANGRTRTVIHWLAPSGRRLRSTLSNDRMSIGREAPATLQFDARGVSRRHAEISREGPVYALRDLGSTNGTFLNGRAIEHAALAAGDVVRLGDVLGVVARGRAELEADDPVVIADCGVFGPGLAELVSVMKRAANSALPVVIQGETGSGKECVARALHVLSTRSGKFHAVNCAALPIGIAEAELFGHRKGAFTGAQQDSLGHLRAAHRGTLFLDELVELPVAVQAKLLRAIQEREVTPLGDTSAVGIDVRLVAAIQEPLAELVASKRLREDLAMRLSGLVIEIPPLRARREDIAALFDEFLKRQSGGRPPALEPRLLERVLLHAWPGNVRELELLAQQLITLHGHEPLLRRHMLPAALRTGVEDEPALRSSDPAPTRNGHDLARLSEQLRNNGGNLARAAEAIGVSRQRAYRLLAGRSVKDLLASETLQVLGERAKGRTE